MMAKDERPNVLRLLAGSGRSGTTWVLDVLASANGLRPVFEPLNPYTSEVAAIYANRYIPRDEPHPELAGLFADAASGELFTLWTHYRVLKGKLRPGPQHLRSVRELKRLGAQWRKTIAQIRSQPAARSNSNTLVKCVRANLLLGWVQSHFDSRIVLILRHPGAVVESQLRSSYMAWNPYPILERYRSEERLVEGPFKTFARLFDKRLSPAGALTLVWGVQNLVPLHEASPEGFSVLFYEELLGDAAGEWNHAIHALGLSVRPGLEMLEKPSQQAAVRWSDEDVPVGGYSMSHDRWRDRLGADECSDIQSVLDSLEVEFYCASRARPNVPAFVARYGNGFRSPKLADATRAPDKYGT